MKVAYTIAELIEMRKDLTLGQPAATVALVATMGALHAGHRSLFRIAHQVADVVVVSIFVNPLQFGPDDDYARYPRVLEEDLAACRDDGVDLVFVPSVSELYPTGRQVLVSSGALGRLLEGRSRPEHFDGVLTIVSKLFNIVRPDKAIFGQKDAQQVACVRRMATDLNYDVDIVSAPVVREDSGLALSSRNRYLLPHQRRAALALSAALRAARGHDTPTTVLEAARRVLELAGTELGFQLEYVNLVHPQSFAELPADYTGQGLLLVAAVVGETRLIDNVELPLASQCEDEVDVGGVNELAGAPQHRG